jgi:predicted homoserine dehydrogenase-like protein
MTYGEAANTAEMRDKRYLPQGLVDGCRLNADIRRDQVITFDDVELPEGRLADRLYAEQCAAFPAASLSRQVGAVA